MKINEAWIRAHLPMAYAVRPLPHVFDGCYRDGWKVMLRGERGGPDRPIYTATDGEDLRLWQFGEVCRSLSDQTELAHRSENAKKWRYSRHHAENGAWLYVERRHYFYDAIEDTRLASFEEYLRLIKPVFPAERWETEVQTHIRLMNRWYKTAHWDYDRCACCFVEISSAKEHDREDGPEEPRPGSVIRVIES